MVSPPMDEKPHPDLQVSSQVRAGAKAERALLLCVTSVGPADAQAEETAESEFVALAEAAGVAVLAVVQAPLRRPHPAYLIHRGKLDELVALVGHVAADVVLCNHPLAPGQERNLERALGVRVVDRNAVILDIFASRARSFEGKLQVELAQLKHLSSRLVGTWTHLERQRGGIGLRGPGESQLETDRRLVAQRIRLLQQRLGQVCAQRRQMRQGRSRSALPVVAVVGYTNAGKSTLFNLLTGADVVVKDQLFATLDPTVRRVALGEGAGALLVDTVGFLRQLPHQLVAAFQATLEEVARADLLLHVVDASDPEHRQHRLAVEQVLQEIGAGDRPRLLVYNKIDRLGCPPGMERDAQGAVRAVHVSAETTQGTALLCEAMREHFFGTLECREIHLGHGQGRLRAALHRLGGVREERCDEHGWCLAVALPRKSWEQLGEMGVG